MKSDTVPESLLEMHFYPALLELFGAHFGIGKVTLLKPTPAREAFVGFDQGWVRAPAARTDLLSELEAYCAHPASAKVPVVYAAFFLQFKVVERMLRSGPLRPTGFPAKYYRSELRLTKSPSSGRGQHETLTILSKIPKTEVHYACGMMFSSAEIWDPPDLSKLRMVDITTSPPPSNWGPNERHFIAFRTKTSPGEWCSEPRAAATQSPKEWVAKDRAYLEPVELLKFLERLLGVPLSEIAGQAPTTRSLEERISWVRKRSRLLPRSLTVLRVSGAEDEKQTK